MLPEAESINKDGSQVLTFVLYTCTLNNWFCLQDGLMEAANIPLQSKEEDQMWKMKTLFSKNTYKPLSFD